jgi:hypothetical protein
MTLSWAWLRRRCEVAQALHQGLRQGGQAGADFHHALAALRCNGLHDGIDDAAVG